MVRTCPVCRARFRSTRECTRCGADLTPLMVLASRAQRARRSSREALLAGDTHKAKLLAAQAQSLMDTPGGRRLLLLTSWLLASEDA